MISFLLIIILWFSQWCNHVSVVDRWKKVRILPPANTRIIKVEGDTIYYEISDKHLVESGSVYFDKDTVFSDRYKNRKEGDMIFFLYCDEHKYLYKADIVTK